MASTYSTNLKIELQATGENPGTWGTITNTNLGTALEQAIVGYGNPSYASDANLTLTYTNTNAAQTARSLVLNVTSAVSLTATRELVVPTIQKQYIVQNNTTGAQSITVKTSAGTGITVPNGRKAHLYVDGTNVIQMFDFVDINGGTIDGTTIGGASAGAGTFTTLTATTLGGALNANSQAITNVNIDSGTIDGVTLGTSSAVTEAQIDNINLNGNTISSTDTNGNLILAPNGTGDVQVNADTLRVGDSNVDATITTNGTGDLILNTNSGSSSGSIRIYDGANGDIEVTANGTGSFNVAPNMLVGTTTDFTSTGAAGSVAVSGYGIYPYTRYNTANPSGFTNSTTNSILLVQNPNFSVDGATSAGLVGAYFSPRGSNSGTGGTNGLAIQGIAGAPLITASAAGVPVFLTAGAFSAVRASSSDLSTSSSNALISVNAFAGMEGTVGSGASSATITGGSFIVYTGSGTTTTLDGVATSTAVGTASTDQNATVTNVSGYRTSIVVGQSSGANTSSITNAYGFNTSSVTIRTGTTVTNYYALFAAAPTVTGTLTNRWGVYIADASSPNYFAGSVQVGAGTAAAPTLTTIADTNTGVFFPAADVVGVSTGGTERARITSGGNILVGTTTDFTSTGAAGGVAVAGYGIYPFTTSSGSTISSTNSGLVVQNPNFAVDGSALSRLYGASFAPVGSNSGSGGSTNGIALVGVYSSPVTTSSGTNARLSIYGGAFWGIRANSSDLSSHASNQVYGLQSLASVDPTVGAGASAASIWGASFIGSSYSGTSTRVVGAVASIAVSNFASSQSATVTNAAVLHSTGALIGQASGATVTVTNVYGLQVDGTSIGATATVTNYYALFAAAPTVTGTLTNRWGIYIDDASSPNYFAGSVRVGAGTAAAPTLTTIADTNTGVFFPAADVVGVSTGGTERARITSNGNLLVGTTTDFTTTGAAGSVAVAGYGIYPYTTYSGTSPSGSVNTTNREPLVIASSASFDGSSSISYHGIGSYPIVAATGTGGTNATVLYGFSAWPQVPSSGASARLTVGGIIARAIRASSSDASSNAANGITGVSSVAGLEGTVASGASSASIIGVASSAYSGSGTTTTLAGFTSRLEASTVSSDQNTTITNASLFIATAITLGRASGPTTSITNLYGTNITGPSVLATATVTNYYAFFAAAPTVTGTLTNRWGVYIADASSPNYFAGSVRVGAGTAAAPTLTTIADTNTGVFFPAADVVGVSTNGTERARVKSTGQVRFVPLSADPAGAEAGDVYYNSTTNKLKVYNGSAWVDLH